MLSTIILARNEQENIEACIDSVSFSDEVIVIDDESSDNTVNIAHKLGAVVHSQRHLQDFSVARNQSMKQAKGDWILFIDADEIVPKSLAKEIKHAIKMNDGETIGYYFKRCDTWWGQEIRHGEAGNSKVLRLVKAGHGTWQGKVHEVLITIGDTKTFNNSLMHYPHTTISDFLAHINFYSTLRAQELYDTKIHTNSFQIMTMPIAKFILNYVFKLGFLDGPAGFVYAFMMSFHTFLVRSKLYQMQDA